MGLLRDLESAMREHESRLSKLEARQGGRRVDDLAHDRCRVLEERASQQHDGLIEALRRIRSLEEHQERQLESNTNVHERTVRLEEVAESSDADVREIVREEMRERGWSNSRWPIPVVLHDSDYCSFCVAPIEGIHWKDSRGMSYCSSVCLMDAIKTDPERGHTLHVSTEVAAADDETRPGILLDEEGGNEPWSIYAKLWNDKKSEGRTAVDENIIWSCYDCGERSDQLHDTFMTIPVGAFFRRMICLECAQKRLDAASAEEDS